MPDYRKRIAEETTTALEGVPGMRTSDREMLGSRAGFVSGKSTKQPPGALKRAYRGAKRFLKRSMGSER